MADRSNYWYMRLKDNYFDSDKQKMLESMKNGYLYSNILLKLYLKSLRSDGRLMFSDRIPYDEKMLATVTGHTVQTVRKALEVFENLDLIERLDTGAIYMLDIQNYIGKSSEEADLKRDMRRRIEEEKNGQMSDKCPTEIPHTRVSAILNNQTTEDTVKGAKDSTPSTTAFEGNSFDDGGMMAYAAIKEAQEYAREHIEVIEPENLIDISEFVRNTGIHPDVVKFVVDEACAAGKNEKWGYCHQILKRYAQDKIFTIERAEADAKAHEDRRKASKQQPAAALQPKVKFFDRGAE